APASSAKGWPPPSAPWRRPTATSWWSAKTRPKNATRRWRSRWAAAIAFTLWACRNRPCRSTRPRTRCCCRRCT
ncbi:hypothetical protein BLA29_015537, partial [Euroglyphus maynei]